MLGSLLELYIHDLSEFIEIDLHATGRFEYRWLDDYWRDPNRIPFLVKVRGNLAGFVLVRSQPAVTRPGETWDIAEFFIARGYRRRGIGMSVAHEIWNRYPGPWEIRVRDSNHPARSFWTEAVGMFTGFTPTEDFIQGNGRSWYVFSFDSPARLAPTSAGGRNRGVADHTRSRSR